MKPLLLSQSDSVGGAARATLRLHRALLRSGIETRMRVGVKRSDLATIDSQPGKLGLAVGMARPFVGEFLMSFQKTLNPIMHSPAILPSGIVKSLNASTADVLNLHWINNEFLTIEDIGRLRKPIVWTMHDMWPFCGAEHYAPDDMATRWRNGYLPGNRLSGHGGFDIDRWTWRRKQKAWRTHMHIVTPSRWLADCVKGSALLGDQPVIVIPNPLDTRQFRPWPKQLARQILGLPPDSPLVLFGAIGGGADPRKGWDLLQAALVLIANDVPGIRCVIFGQTEPVNPPRLGVHLHWMGRLNDDATLALLYSATDVMVVPSRQENLPQSGTEAQACGCPVVAFNCTGLPDVVVHGETGYLAAPYDVEDFANGILWVLENRDRYTHLSVSAHARAESLWAEEVVVNQYLPVYQQAIMANCE